MNLVIYNPNSKGGNFDYAQRIFDGYKISSEVESCTLLVPSNVTSLHRQGISPVLLSDQPNTKVRLFSQLYFLFRSAVNPFILLIFLIRNRSVKIVLFNDYDQATSLLWVPFFRILLRERVFAVVLHDPDRDLYFSWRAISNLTMEVVMSLIDIAFYHEVLPERVYYKPEVVKFVAVPHGLYFDQGTVYDADLKEQIRKFKGNDKLIAGLGNIRGEKNYPMIIQALAKIQGVKFLICGMPANTAIKLEDYKSLVQRCGIEDRVLLINKYLSASELKATVEVSDAIIMYYANTFRSQSGLLNLVAPYKAKLMVSDNGSPLSMTVRRYNLGLLALPDSENELMGMLAQFKANQFPAPEWEKYFEYASWENFVEITLEAFKEKSHDLD